VVKLSLGTARIEPGSRYRWEHHCKKDAKLKCILAAI
jgi:hypothetical protein